MTSTEQKDYYRILGVKRNAGEDEIRKAYRRLARKHHPDVNPGDRAAEDRFKNIQEAYGVLSDRKKRQMYDQFGFYSETGAYPGAGTRTGPGGSTSAASIFPTFFRRPGRAHVAVRDPDQVGADSRICSRKSFARGGASRRRRRRRRARISNTRSTSGSGTPFAARPCG